MIERIPPNYPWPFLPGKLDGPLKKFDTPLLFRPDKAPKPEHFIRIVQIDRVQINSATIEDVGRSLRDGGHPVTPQRADNPDGRGEIAEERAVIVVPVAIEQKIQAGTCTDFHEGDGTVLRHGGNLSE